jgi:malate permease and related proteins
MNPFLLFLSQTHDLFVRVILPILLLVGLGAFVQSRLKLDLTPISRIQIYLFVPTFLFIGVFDSNLSWLIMGKVAGAVVLVKLCIGLPLFFVLRARKVAPAMIAAMILSSALFNAGNFGIPVIDRAFGQEGRSVQALVVMVANLSIWGVGAILTTTLTGGSFKSGVIAYLKLPMVYCLILALALKAFHVKMPEFLTYPLHQIADAIVPLSMLTLGMQLAQRRPELRAKIILPVLFLKLIAMPAVATAIVVFFRLWPSMVGAVIIVASAGPTAVNTVLLAMEQKGDVELAAECVFWTTVFSALTATLVLSLVATYGGPVRLH